VERVEDGLQPGSQVLSAEELRALDAFWRAADDLSVGQICLLDNPRLREEFRIEHSKPRLLGHWWTCPGLNFACVHLNRTIRKHDIDMIFVTGPGHSGPSLLANTYLEETLTEGSKRMGADPHTNGGMLIQELRLPEFRDYAVDVQRPGAIGAETTRVMGTFLRDVFKLNEENRNFRIVGPDETASNRLDAAFEATGKTWLAALHPNDEILASDGRVMEVLSEHLCQGWLEGYLHGLFFCYEAFIHIVDSVFNQHAKWLKVARDVPWGRSIASMNYLLTSNVWRWDHNGFSQQDPGFIDHVADERADIIRVYLRPDANTLLCVIDCCLRSWNLVKVIVAGKQPALQYLDMGTAVKHCQAGISASGLGPATITEGNQTSSWPARETSRPSRPWPPWVFCGSTSPISGSGWLTWST